MKILKPLHQNNASKEIPVALDKNGKILDRNGTKEQEILDKLPLEKV